MSSLRSLDVMWNKSSHFPARWATGDAPSMARHVTRPRETAGPARVRALPDTAALRVRHPIFKPPVHLGQVKTAPGTALIQGRGCGKKAQVQCTSLREASQQLPAASASNTQQGRAAQPLCTSCLHVVPLPPNCIDCKTPVKGTLPAAPQELTGTWKRASSCPCGGSWQMSQQPAPCARGQRRGWQGQGRPWTTQPSQQQCPQQRRRKRGSQ